MLIFDDLMKTYYYSLIYNALSLHLFVIRSMCSVITRLFLMKL
jgi:hypothetical protein